MQAGIAFLLYELFPQIRQAARAAAPVRGTAGLIDAGRLLIINLYAYDLTNRQLDYGDLQQALADACRLLSGTLPRWAAERTVLRVAAYVFGTSTGTACPDRVRRIISAVWQGSAPKRATQLTVYERAYTPVRRPGGDGGARNDLETRRYIDAVGRTIAQRRGAAQLHTDSTQSELGGRPKSDPASLHKTVPQRWEEDQKRRCEHCARYGVAGRIRGQPYKIHAEHDCPFNQGFDAFKMHTWQQLVRRAPPSAAQRRVADEFWRRHDTDPGFARRWKKYREGKAPVV